MFRLVNGKTPLTNQLIAILKGPSYARQQVITQVAFLTMQYRLALALGSTFLGWCALETLDHTPVRILDMGVRVFPNGRDSQSGESLAVARYYARLKRRNLDRTKLRRKRLMKFMIESGLMPADEQARKELQNTDPYELRAKALDEKIPLHHLGRALFHISQRRGFKSLRIPGKGDDEADDDSSNMKGAIKDLHGKLLATRSRTLGEYLYNRHRDRHPVRVRIRVVNNKAEYSFYPGRNMYEQEVDAILAVQKNHHPQLTEKVCEGLRDIIFYERPMKPRPVGKCRLESAEPRARLALPLARRFRIWQEVNDLEIEGLADGGPPLELKDRKKIVEVLLSSRKKTFGQIRKLLGLEPGCRFNLETGERNELRGDITSFFLSDEQCFGPRWRELSSDQQENLLTMLFTEPDPGRLREALMTEWDLSSEQAEEIISITATHDDRDGISNHYGHFSKKAILKIMPWLEQGHKFHEAARLAGYRPSEIHAGDRHDRLPYYGQVLPDSVIGGSYDDKDKDLPERYYGKVNNPSLHIGLNQVRKLVNAVIEVYGTPDEIVVGIARDLKQPWGDIARKQGKNRKDIDRINKELEKLNVRKNYRNRMLFSLWEDLAQAPQHRCCPFSGIPVAMSDIFEKDFEDVHLLPFSRSYDDRRANRVLSSREWNHRKANKSPFEAFGHTGDWPQIMARVQNLPADMQWRFRKDAWAKMEGKDGVMARMLNDTHHMAQWTRQYLSFLLDSEKRKSCVWAVAGQMTPLLREKWRINDFLGEEDGPDNRADHRHHSLDAVTIGCTDRRMLETVSETARTLEENETLRGKRHELVTGLPEPFAGFREQLEEHLTRMVVSYKPDHGGADKAIRAERPYTVAALHRQTAYGLAGIPGEDTTSFATRVSVESLLSTADIETVIDAEIRRKLLAAVEGLKTGGKEWKQALERAAAPGGIMKSGIRRIRVHVKKTPGTMVGIVQPHERGRDGAQPFKFYELRGNYSAEIFCSGKGKKAGEWQCEVISNYHAHQKDFIPNWRKEDPTARLIMRLQKNDMVAYESEGTDVICKVKKTGRRKSGGTIFLRPHTIAIEDANTLTWEASAYQLQLKNARKLSVDIMGRVKDPAHMKKPAAAA
jgi:CRISPR-associated endonuclease Csn1